MFLEDNASTRRWMVRRNWIFDREQYSPESYATRYEVKCEVNLTHCKVKASLQKKSKGSRQVTWTTRNKRGNQTSYTGLCLYQPFL